MLQHFVSLHHRAQVALKLQTGKFNYSALYPQQGCQIGHFMANFKKFVHFLTALAMKKRIWPFCNIWPFFGLSL